MALKGQLSDQQRICQTLLATHKEQDKTLALHSKQEDWERKNKDKKKADGPPSKTPSKQPGTTARFSGKLTAPFLPDKATTV